MFWVQLYGKGPDGKPGVDQIATPFPTLEAGHREGQIPGGEQYILLGKGNWIQSD
jgi:hypothetical protein